MDSRNEWTFSFSREGEADQKEVKEGTVLFFSLFFSPFFYQTEEAELVHAYYFRLCIPLKSALSLLLYECE